MSDDLTPSAALLTASFRPPTTTTSAPTAASTVPEFPAAASAVESYSQCGGFNPAQVETLIRWEKDNLAKGHITPEEATKRIDALGATAEQRSPDLRSAEMKQLDKDFLPAKEHEFLVNLYPPGQAPAVIPKEVQAFEANVRGWMGPDGAGLSRKQGNSLITTISRMLRQTHTLSANERDTYKDHENAKLDSLFGPDWHADLLKPVARMIHEIDQKRHGLKAFVAEHGDNALFLTQLIQAARIYDARKGR